MKVSLNGKGTIALLDTGAAVSCLSLQLYKNTSSNVEKKYPIQDCKINFVKGIGGHMIDVLGSVALPVKINGLVLWQEFIILPQCDSPPLILGANFLKIQNAVWNFTNDTVSLQGGMVVVKLTTAVNMELNSVYLIRTTSDVVIPAQSELILPVKVSKKGKQKECITAGVIEPTISVQNKYMVTGPKCAVEPEKNGNCCYRMINPLMTDTLIPGNTTVGSMSPIHDETKLVYMSKTPDKITNMTYPDKVLVSQDSSVKSDSSMCDTDKIGTQSEVFSVHLDKLQDYSSHANIASVHCVTEQTHDKEYYIQIAKDLNIDIETKHITKEQHDDILALIGKNRDVFAVNANELGCYDNYKYVIDTGDHEPVKSRFYRTSPANKAEIERQVSELLEAGVIERSTSDWLSPVILVRKGTSNSSWRMCIDYRGLNKVVKPIYFPLPRHEDVVDALGQSRPTIFSTLDLAQAFLQVALDPSTKHKTAFITHHGVFQYNKLPFGLCNSPSIFSSIMTNVLRDFLYVYAIVYADDILLYSADVNVHLKHLEQVFKTLRKAGLRLRPDKCLFAHSQVTYLGHQISKEGISVNPEKTKAIMTFPIPTTPTQVRAFLGVCQYYRRFVRHFSDVASSLNNLLKKGAKFVWDSQCQNSFDKLKVLLSSPPILAFPNFEKEFILYTDASTAAISYILGQRDDRGREVVISYGGRSLRDTERRWAISELECLAMVEGIRQYHVYLSDRPFTVITDHAALQYIQNYKLNSGRLCRWSVFLQQYRYTVKYKKGSLHKNADSLSRREYPPTTSTPSTWVGTVTECPDVTTMVKTLTCNTNTPPDHNSYDQVEKHYVQLNSVRHLQAVMATESRSVQDLQKSDRNLKMIIDYLNEEKLPADMTDIEQRRFIAESHEYVIDPDDNLLYHLYYPRGKGIKANRVVKQLVVPESLKHDVMLSYHDSLLGGHQGFDRTFHLIRLKYFFKQMYGQIKQYVQSCRKCQLNKRDFHKQKAPLVPLSHDGIFSRIHVDLFGPLPKVNGYRYCLLVMDAFSKWSEAFPVKTLTGAVVQNKICWCKDIRVGY